MFLEICHDYPLSIFQRKLERVINVDLFTCLYASGGRGMEDNVLFRHFPNMFLIIIGFSKGSWLDVCKNSVASDVDQATGRAVVEMKGLQEDFKSGGNGYVRRRMPLGFNDTPCLLPLIS